VLADGVGSGMSWSPDARWLCYTMAPAGGPEGLPPGWLFDTAPNLPAGREPREPAQSSASSSYRIWITHRDAQPSVRMQESAWRLTAPAWSPHGRSVTFGRFTPESMEPLPTVPQGRLEIVVQDGLDRKQVLLVVSGIELDAETRASFPLLAPAWSPDGQ